MTGLRRTLHVFRVFLVEGLSASVLCFCLCTPGLAIPLAEPVPATTEDLLQMTEESLYADWEENRAFVRGVGRVVQNTAQGRLLARRAALTDARRGLLLLRGHILEDPALREEVERQALIKTLHFIYYVQNELQENWSVADDEYWNDPLPPAARELPTEWQEIVRRMPPVPYVRESRRAVGQRTLTSAELLQNSLSYRDGQTSHEFPNAIAIGGYILDLHGADTDSDMEWELGERALSSELNRPRGPFQVPMDVLIPSDVEGFLVAEKNLSMSRLSAGALRLQPICMMTGQAAGALAALSTREGVRLRDLPAFHVQWALLNAGVELSLCRYSDVPPEHPCYRSIQISNLYGLTEPSEYPHASSYNIQDLDDPVLAMALIKGDDKGLFGTDEMITRKEMASMIARGLAACGAKRSVPAAPEGKPDAFVTRGVLARELCAAFGFQEAPRPQKGRTAFRASEHPNAPAVNALAALGVLDIYRGDGEFRFGHPVTRSEAIDVLVRAMAAAGLPGK